VIENMGVNLQPVFMTLIDHRPVKIGRQPRCPAVSIIDPDLDEVYFFNCEFLNCLSRLIFRSDLIGNAGVRRAPGPGVRGAYTPSSDAKPRTTKFSRLLIRANVKFSAL
jgi:hypothetical protein